MTSGSATERRDNDFEQILAAVMETARGRWFLAEFARRNRSADTAAVLAAVGRVEGKLRRPPPRPDLVEGDNKQLVRQLTEALLLLREGENALAAALGDGWAETAMIASRNAETRLEGALFSLGARLPPRPLRGTAARPVEPVNPAETVSQVAPAPAEERQTPPPAPVAAVPAPATEPIAPPASTPDPPAPQSRPEPASASLPSPEPSFADRLAAELAAIPLPQPAEPVLQPMTIAASVVLPRPAVARPATIAAAPVALPEPVPPAATLPPLPERPVIAPLRQAEPTPAPLSSFRPSTLVNLRQRAPARDVALENDPTASMTRAEKIALFS
jgi:hypothetical protein